MAEDQGKGGKHSSPTAGGSQSFTWLAVAKQEVGVKERPGMADNPRIIQYHATTTLRATDDEVPWCSSFVNWCFAQRGYTGTRSAAARSWINWGARLDRPVLGCVVVMTRTGGGHVGFYMGEDDSHVLVLGGNQDDAVNIRKYPKSRVIGYRLPKDLQPIDQQHYERLMGAA